MNNTIIHQELSLNDLNNVVGGARSGKPLSNGLHNVSPAVSNHPAAHPVIRPF